MDFSAYLLRFRFVARDPIFFPAGKPENVLRGAFGTIFRKLACVPQCPGTVACELRAQCPYARIFEPVAAAGEGPSGFAAWPRPFVFRAGHLDGARLEPGAEFSFDLNLFEMRNPAIAYFVQTFAELVREGLGRGRGKAELVEVSLREDGVVLFDGSAMKSVDILPRTFDLSAGSEPISRLTVKFISPTELKSEQQVTSRPEFGVLFARTRDRVATLRSLYGAGPLNVDFNAMGERASRVEMTRCETRLHEVSRLSARTGQRHPLGGMVGEAEYEGEGLEEFVPWLVAGGVTGVGRQTTWGKGEILVQVR